MADMGPLDINIIKPFPCSNYMIRWFKGFIYPFITAQYEAGAMSGYSDLSFSNTLILKCVRYSDVIMGAMASQTISITIVYFTVYSGADQRKHQSSASLASVRGIHRWPVNSPHKWPATRKCFHFMTSSWILFFGDGLASVWCKNFNWICDLQRRHMVALATLSYQKAYFNTFINILITSLCQHFSEIFQMLAVWKSLLKMLKGRSFD